MSDGLVTCPICGAQRVTTDTDGQMDPHEIPGTHDKVCAGSGIHPLAAACWLGEIIDDTHLDYDP